MLQVLLPDLVARKIVAAQIAAAHEGPNMRAIGRRRWRRQIAFITSSVLVARADGPLPELFAARIECQQDEIFAGERCEKDMIAPNDGRGPGRARQRRSPDDVLGFAERCRDIFLGADAVEFRSAPLRPILGAQ